MGRGDNRDLVRELAGQLPCQVGGGIRSIEAAQATLNLGARRVILGSSLISQGAINAAFAREAAIELGPEKLVFAADCRGGYVAIKGWQEATGITAHEMMRALDPFCDAFLYTHIDTEGLLQGIPLEVIRSLRTATSHRLIAAGGIRSVEEVAALDAIGVDAVVGMAIYRGLLPADRVRHLRIPNTSTKWWGPRPEHHLVHYHLAHGELVNVVGVVPEDWRTESWAAEGTTADLVEFVQVKYAPSGDIWASFVKEMCPGEKTSACTWDYALHANSVFQGAVGRLAHP